MRRLALAPAYDDEPRIGGAWQRGTDPRIGHATVDRAVRGER